MRHTRAVLQPAGVDGSQYSGHSFRIGAATAAAARAAAATAAVRDSLIQTLGRWQSAAYLLYVRVPRERLAAISRHCRQPKPGDI